MKRKTRQSIALSAFIVGGVICWDSSGDRSEDDDSVVDYYHCMQCGASYEVCQPNEEEKQDYKGYWEKCQQNQNK